MNTLSSQDEKELLAFIKEWLKIHGYSQKHLAKELKLPSSRTSELTKKIKELYRKGGIRNIAKRLIKIEQYWLNDDDIISSKENYESKPYDQLDIDYKVDLDALLDQIVKENDN